MDKKLIVVFLLLLLPLTIFAADSAEKVDDLVIEELEQSETVSIVVVLEENAELLQDSEEVIITDDAWHTTDAEIDIVDIEITHTYDAALNGFAAEVTEEGLAELEASDHVERVYYDQVYSLALDYSVPQVNVTNAHNVQINDISLTGQGQTICVIDTGINYNHADLGGCFGDNNASSECKVIGGEDLYNGDLDPMDDHGHGTHVAGIAAADGVLTGVAPGANLIAMKVFGSDQSTTASKIIAGIDWCVSNSSKYNISVITMSLSLTNGLGSEIIFSSESECDSYDSDGGVVVAANDAAAQGLLVTSAAGNDGSTDGIALPACGSNITSVGGVDDSNKIYFNRAAILDMLAPGVYINSTDEFGSAYVELSGTSMSTPHAAGAGAILQQYAQDFEDRTLTPVQIEQALVDYGTLINDTNATELNYPLLNVYSALLSLDSVGPEITSDAPNGSTISINDTIQISVSDLHSVSDVWYMKEVELYEPYSDGTDWFIDANWSTGEHQITVYANDSNSQVSYIDLVLTISSAPTIDSWSWSNSSGEFNESDIVINESDTLSAIVDASDVDGDTLTYIWFLRDVEINNSQNMSYDVALNDSGNTTLHVFVSDGANNVSENWSILIVDPFPPSIATIPNQNHNESAWELDVLSYITNPDGDHLIYSVSSGFSINDSVVITRTFGCSDSGDYAVEVNVSDGYTSVSDIFDLSISDSCGSTDTSDDDADSGGDDGDDSSDDDLLSSLVAEANVASAATSSSSSSSNENKTETKVTKKVVPKKIINNTSNDTATFTTSDKPFSFDILGKLVDDFDYNDIDMKYKQIIAVVFCGALVGAYLYPHYHSKHKKTLKVKLHHGYEKNWRK
jgi:subtilisin family serine protease